MLGGGIAPFELLQRLAHRLDADGFEQVIDTVHLESLDGILIVGGGEDDGGVDGHAIEDAEGIAIRQLDVHEDQVGCGMALEPTDTFEHRIQLSQYLDGRVNLVNQTLDVLRSGYFVFDNQDLHVRAVLG